MKLGCWPDEIKAHLIEANTSNGNCFSQFFVVCFLFALYVLTYTHNANKNFLLQYLYVTSNQINDC